MLRIEYNRHCGYKPVQLGVHIAKLVTDGNIPCTFRFLMFEDICVKLEDGTIDDSKHMCILFMLDDADGSEKDFIPMHDFATVLAADKKINSECREEEGVGRIIEGNIVKRDLKVDGSDADPRIKVMRLDYEWFAEYMKQAAEFEKKTDIFSYSEEDGYFMVQLTNEKGLDEIQNMGQTDEYREVENCRLRGRMMKFIKAHWPDEHPEMWVESHLVDTGDVVFDEEDKTNRHVWKFSFRLYDKDRNEIKGNYAVNAGKARLKI